MQNGGGETAPCHRLGLESSHCPLGPNKHLAFVRAWGGSGCSSPRPEPDWQVCLCEPSRPRLPRAQCWTLATGHWPAGSWCRPARVSHFAPQHSNDFLLPGPSTREQLQVSWQPRSLQAPRRAGGVLTEKRGASVTIVRISDAHWPEGPGECAPGKESPHPGLRLLPTNRHSTSSSTKTHLRSMSPLPRDARDPRLSQLSRQPQDHMAWRLPDPGKGLGLTKGPGRGGGGAGGGRDMKRKCRGGRAGEGGGPEGCVCHLDLGVEGQGFRGWEGGGLRTNGSPLVGRNLQAGTPNLRAENKAQKCRKA